MKREEKRRETFAGGLSGLLVIAFVILFGSTFDSCSSIECPVQNTVALVCELNDTLKDTLTVWTRRRNGKDSIILNKKENATSFHLPISYQNPVDTLLFGTTNLAVVDTVWIEKDNMPHFESVDCGVAYFHTLRSVRSTHRGIDSLVITKSFVDYDLTSTHILIYFKARN